MEEGDMNTTSKRILAATTLALPLLGGGTALAQTGNPSQSTTHHQSLPPGFHWRQVWYQINDCGPHNKGQAKFIIWKGNGDMQSALFCPNDTIWPS